MNILFTLIISCIRQNYFSVCWLFPRGSLYTKLEAKQGEPPVPSHTIIMSIPVRLGRIGLPPPPPPIVRGRCSLRIRSITTRSTSPPIGAASIRPPMLQYDASVWHHPHCNFSAWRCHTSRDDAVRAVDPLWLDRHPPPIGAASSPPLTPQYDTSTRHNRRRCHAIITKWHFQKSKLHEGDLCKQLSKTDTKR